MVCSWHTGVLDSLRAATDPSPPDDPGGAFRPFCGWVRLLAVRFYTGLVVAFALRRHRLLAYCSSWSSTGRARPSTGSPGSTGRGSFLLVPGALARRWRPPGGTGWAECRHRCSSWPYHERRSAWCRSCERCGGCLAHPECGFQAWLGGPGSPVRDALLAENGTPDWDRGVGGGCDG